MKIQLNGSPAETAARSISELVAEQALVPGMLLVEHNGIALLRSEWDHTSLADGDRIEFLRVAAGG